MWHLLSRLVFAAGAVVAVFVVAWYFYIHDHAARTKDGVAVSVARVFDSGELRCREKGRGWSCSSDYQSEVRFIVVRDGKKNCWRAERKGRRRGERGCVKVIDYVRGLAP